MRAPAPPAPPACTPRDKGLTNCRQVARASPNVEAVNSALFAGKVLTSSHLRADIPVMASPARAKVRERFNIVISIVMSCPRRRLDRRRLSIPSSNRRLLKFVFYEISNIIL